MQYPNELGQNKGEQKTTSSNVDPIQQQQVFQMQHPCKVNVEYHVFREWICQKPFTWLFIQHYTLCKVLDLQMSGQCKAHLFIPYSSKTLIQSLGSYAVSKNQFSDMQIKALCASRHGDENQGEAANTDYTYLDTISMNDWTMFLVNGPVQNL